MGTGRNRAAGPAMSPELAYRDASDAIRWLCDVLGLQRGLVVEGDDSRVVHAELLVARLRRLRRVDG